MKIGIISDVHGNAFALEKVLLHITPLCDRIIGLGDLFGYFPGHLAVYAIIKQLNIPVLIGNHEAMIMKMTAIPPNHSEVYRHDLVRRELGVEAVGAITTGTSFLFFKELGRRVLFVHGTPWDPLHGRLYPDSDLSFLSQVDAEVILMGHTHYPFSTTVGGKLIGNPGSVGLPRDAGDLASFGVLDLVRCRFDVYRIPLDANEILSAYPDVDRSVRGVVLGRRQANPFGIHISTKYPL